MIIQGGNTPIVIQFNEDMSGVAKFHAALYAGNADSPNVIKTWNKANAVFDGAEVSLPISEAQSAAMPSGTAMLDVKWSENGNIVFAETMKVVILARGDKDTLLYD